MNIVMLQPPGVGPAGQAAPGQAPAAKQPVPSQPAQGPPAADGEGGPPPGQSPSAFGGMALLLPFLLLFGLLFLMNRGEKKKRAKLESSLKKGDRVVTRAGIKGKLLDLSPGEARVEIAPGVTVTMLKGAIEGIDGGDAASKAPAKAPARGGFFGFGARKDDDADKDDKKK